MIELSSMTGDLSKHSNEDKESNNEHMEPLLKEQLEKSQILKSKVIADIGNVASPDRLQLLDLYHKIVIEHLDYALNNKVDQELWNTIYKQPIAHFQAQIRDVKNSRMAEAQVTLGLLVDQGTGYYISLLGTICQKYQVSLPCRKPLSGIRIPLPAHLMIKSNDNIKLASRSSKSTLHSKSMKFTASDCDKNKGGRFAKRPSLTIVESIVEHSLVHLGDLARYVHHLDHAANYYMWAVKLAAGSRGHPFNQLAILEDGKSNRMKMIYFYMRALSSVNSFPAASTNLTNLMDRISRDTLPPPPAITRCDKSTGLTHWLASAFLHAHAMGFKKKVESMELVTNANSMWDKFCSILSRNGHMFAGGERANLYLVNLAAVHVFMLTSSELISFTSVTVSEKKQKSNVPKIYTRAAHSGPPSTHWLAFLLQSSAKLVQSLVTILSSNLLSKENQSELTITESKYESVFAALLIILLWYRQSNHMKVFQKDVNNSMIQSACAIDSTVTEFLNKLQSQFHIDATQTSLDSLHLDQLGDLPELEHLQGFQALTLPKSSSPLIYHENLDAVQDNGSPVSPPKSSDFNVNHLRLRAILWCARQLPDSVVTKTKSDSDPTVSYITFTSVTPIPSSPVTNENAVQPPSVSPASRNQSKRNVAIESIMQNFPQRTPLVTSFAANPVTNIFHEHEPIKPGETQKVNNMPEQKFISESNTEKDSNKTTHSNSNQPGIIINADIAKFIHEQSSQFDGSKSQTTVLNPRPMNLPILQPGTAAKLSSNNSSASLSSQSAANQSLCASSAQSKQLYNENREQFQRDLPPRFAAARGRVHQQHDKRFHDDSGQLIPKPPVTCSESLYQHSPSLPVPDLTKKETESPLPSESQECSPMPPTPPAFFFQDGISPLTNMKPGVLGSMGLVGRSSDAQTTRAESLFSMNSLWSGIQTASNSHHKDDGSLLTANMPESLFSNHQTLINQNAANMNSSRTLSNASDIQDQRAQSYALQRPPDMSQLKSDSSLFPISHQNSFSNVNQTPYQKAMPSSSGSFGPSGSIFDSPQNNSSVHSLWSFPLEHLLNQQLSSSGANLSPKDVTNANNPTLPVQRNTTYSQPSQSGMTGSLMTKPHNALFHAPSYSSTNSAVFNSHGQGQGHHYQQSQSGSETLMHRNMSDAGTQQYSWMNSISANRYPNFVQANTPQNNQNTLGLASKLSNPNNNNFSSGNNRFFTNVSGASNPGSGPFNSSDSFSDNILK